MEKQRPPLNARFFYTSPLAIDDPLSPVPPAVSSSASAARLAPRPFTAYDSDRLEEAWHELRKRNVEHAGEKREKLKRESEDRTRNRLSAGKEMKIPTRTRNGSLVEPRIDSSFSSATSNRFHTPSSRPGSAGGPKKKEESAVPPRQGARELEEQPTIEDIIAHETELPATTGTPFIRAPSRKKVPQAPTNMNDTIPSRPQPHVLDSYKWDQDDNLKDETIPNDITTDTTSPMVQVPVGVSRLHHVIMPIMNMEPIYWSPNSDVSPIARATWFYKDTMLPLEIPVANMLELGYNELQVWSQTWQDELNSAIEVGAAGEERICRRLWPDFTKPVVSRPQTAMGEVTDMTQSFDQPLLTPEQIRNKFQEEAAVALDAASVTEGKDLQARGSTAFATSPVQKTYANAGVIYADADEARILKTSLLPSAYYGRRPLANYIRKNRELGIAVVRGFNQAAWDKLHPPPKGSKTAKAYAGVSANEMSSTSDDQTKDPRLAHATSPKVTDLVLAIHGIGQKLSERMESWHFTHAMNSFRREVNVELGSDAVRNNLKEDTGGIMVLPVNWRHSLSFEEGGFRTDEDQDENQFGLKDITPETLSSVRNIVSDVMLDIPYYLSHHQPKMIAAVLHEANRIYKLWCSNNPGFDREGRVHIVAHSLGSVMALDILSKQPTKLPVELSDPSKVDLSTTDLKHFLFPVSNLFLAGSPAGFFLLLKRAGLRPRIDHAKVGADPSANITSICGKQGEYGCIAVDNIYNFINPYDPVSYRLNATVDATYAASLKPAWVPSASAGWFGSSSSDSNSGVLGGLFGSGAPSKPASRPGQAPQSPAILGPMTPGSEGGGAGMLPRLPSNVELETHDFSREELAEKRMYGLNDNGQIDYMLRYGGGALDIQYLTMLGAHSSYWLLKDFVRVMVMEIGRKPGSEGVRRAMAAVKKKRI